MAEEAAEGETKPKGEAEPKAEGAAAGREVTVEEQGANKCQCDKIKCYSYL